MPVEVNDDDVVLRYRNMYVKILLHGATIISWKVDDKERLFLSSAAKLDGSQPVRGGIPIVFPCFGPPTLKEHSKLPPHGFARNEKWRFEEVVMDHDESLMIRIVFEPNDRTNAVFPYDFKLAHAISLRGNGLTSVFIVRNNSTLRRPRPFEFQALFHNYVLAPADEVKITPLKDLTYYDKTESTDEGRATPKVETRDEVTVSNYTDSVYENGSTVYEISWPDGYFKIKTTNGNFKDVVVWNPQEEGRKIGDMEPEGWKKYVCVEPGYVRGFVRLGHQATWYCGQTLTVEPDV